jgi:phosphotransferase system HPr (HPr) family protein
MTATFFRVDPRLVHATLMNAWVPAVGAKQIIVVDTEVASDQRARNILAMSAMDVPIEFVREEDAKQVTNLPELGPRIVLFVSLPSAERALAAGLTMRELGIGHLPEAPGRVPVLPAVHLGANDRAVVRRLERRGVDVYIQPLPRDERILVSELEAGRAPAARAMSEPRPTPEPTPTKLHRLSAKMRVINERGLHLRAAHALAHLAANLQENVQVANGPDFVNAKSLLGLTTLGATCGTVLEIVVTGPDPASALEKIKALFASGFEEGAKPGLQVEVDG